MIKSDPNGFDIIELERERESNLFQHESRSYLFTYCSRGLVACFVSTQRKVFEKSFTSAGVIEGGLKRQLCENHCNQPTNSGCHYGQICVSNGCGHHCVFPLVKRQRCPPVRCMACPDGYELDEHGCQTCQCRPAKRSPCPMYMCAMFCENGFKVGADGCQVCSCA
ncbi:hypothetical protein Btru_058279 [Bulinus truncatus]|nr:hypothetical protein Btru_058279 [Bulinus truncatus]